MGKVADELAADDTTPSASARVICEEFLKVLGRKEVEQPMICQRICVCSQFWRYQHYLLPLWKWGVNKMVCFGLGSLRNVTENGGPFADAGSEYTYRSVIRNAELVEAFNAREVDRHDALQAMLRHVAAIEMASMMKFCSSRRGVEHQLIKHYFKKLTAIQNLPGSVAEISGKIVEKLGKLPPTAGYAGDTDLTDIPVHLHDPEYTAEDKDALGRLCVIMEMAHLPPVKVVDTAGREGDYRVVDEHTLVYAVGPDFPVRSMVLGGSKPAAMVWRDHGLAPESGDVVNDEIRALFDDYEEFKLDKRTAPHTLGSSHLYIRKDIVEAAEREKIVPPYPVTFPHDYPYRHGNWYLDQLEKNGREKVVKRGTKAKGLS
ncbi:hypothetical protein C8A00DRAFT_34992 [Chaetomidium leptoderma]|uniref:Uncharacterized protein n=1 Tax=Chaetomidium leptoderma TaxID=669021 RepID=A0AAN6ZW58_9PEZI|nr:hypothetical protein C8A00DRAFT_34992 [Chaetomidium leptoderma]